MSVTTSADGPSRRARILAAIGISALIMALVHRAYGLLPPGSGLAPDFDQIWLGSRALLQGRNPYVEVPRSGFVAPLYYPLPAMLVGAPFALLPLSSARVAFVGAGAFLLAYALTARAWHPLLWLAGGPYLAAAIAGQWSPFVTAAVILPAVGLTWAAKPTVALPLFVGWPGWRPVAWAAGLAVLSLLIRPGWVHDWLAAIRDAPVAAPIQRPLGVLLLLALARWRRPEARMLAGMALIPHSELMYDLVPLVLVCRTRRETLLLAALGLLALVIAPHASPDTIVADTRREWPFIFGLQYLPALVMVLLRPNESRE
jgi:hypothetical protein